MIIIPELKKVVLLVPRTGSTSLKEAILKRYPLAMLLYRHMEADGVPMGYDRWEKIGVVRNPIDRLWSLYNYLQDFNGEYEPEYVEAMQLSVLGCDFSSWIVNNNVVFTNGHSECSNEYFPKYTVRYSLPENRKSQFIYLRPDLGTKIYRYESLDKLAKDLDIELLHLNHSSKQDVSKINGNAIDHIHRFFEWDLFWRGEL